jgi:hypothetical protein
MQAKTGGQQKVVPARLPTLSGGGGFEDDIRGMPPLGGGGGGGGGGGMPSMGGGSMPGMDGGGMRGSGGGLGRLPAPDPFQKPGKFNVQQDTSELAAFSRDLPARKPFEAGGLGGKMPAMGGNVDMQTPQHILEMDPMQQGKRGTLDAIGGPGGDHSHHPVPLWQTATAISD